MVLILLILAVALVEKSKMLSDICDIVVMKDKDNNIWAEIRFADGGKWTVDNVLVCPKAYQGENNVVYSIVERRVCGKRMMRIA